MVRHSMKLHLQAAIAAFQFLTRLPIPVQVPFAGDVLRRSVIYFPLAGALIGLCISMLAWLLSFLLPVGPSAVIVLGLWIALSGGLHLDGWMDTADGVLSHRSRERMLEIMKDSRVGAMGVIAAVLLLILKWSLLSELMDLESEHRTAGLLLLAIIPMWSRAWMAAAIAGWPNARQGEGIGAMFNGVKGIAVLAAFFIAALCSALVLSFYFVSTIHILMALIILLFITIAVGSGLASALNRKLGGLTGDTYGAMNEAIEAVLLVAAGMWIYAGA